MPFMFIVKCSTTQDIFLLTEDEITSTDPKVNQHTRFLMSGKLHPGTILFFSNNENEVRTKFKKLTTAKTKEAVKVKENTSKQRNQRNNRGNLPKKFKSFQCDLPSSSIKSADDNLTEQIQSLIDDASNDMESLNTDTTPSSPSHKTTNSGDGTVEQALQTCHKEDAKSDDAEDSRSEESVVESREKNDQDNNSTSEIDSENESSGNGNPKQKKLPLREIDKFVQDQEQVDFSGILAECSDDNQLFGKDYCEDGTTMVRLISDVYCRKTVLASAIGTDVTCSTHIARRLIPGVFKAEAVLKGTISGQPPRAQGLARKLEPCIRLNSHAISAIVAFSIKWATKEKLEKKNVREILESMRQKINEIKRDKRYAEKNNTPFKYK